MTPNKGYLLPASVDGSAAILSSFKCDLLGVAKLGLNLARMRRAFVRAISLKRLKLEGDPLPGGNFPAEFRSVEPHRVTLACLYEHMLVCHFNNFADNL